MIKATVAFVHTNLQMLGLCWGSLEDGNDVWMIYEWNIQNVVAYINRYIRRNCKQKNQKKNQFLGFHLNEVVWKEVNASLLSFGVYFQFCNHKIMLIYLVCHYDRQFWSDGVAVWMMFSCWWGPKNDSWPQMYDLHCTMATQMNGVHFFSHKPCSLLCWPDGCVIVLASVK